MTVDAAEAATLKYAAEAASHASDGGRGVRQVAVNGGGGRFRRCDETADNQMHPLFCSGPDPRTGQQCYGYRPCT